MNKNNNAFTLIEMIVGVSITVILMISVGIFVSSGMNNITIQKQILDQNSEIGNLVEDLNNIFGKNFEVIENTQTSILVKTNYILGKSSYYKISEITSTGYCKNEPDLENKYLQIKNFNPFILSGTTYSGSYTQNVIYSGGQIIAGKGIFGDSFTDGSDGTGIYLNNPASITNSGNLIFITDSGNNRVLYMSGNQVYKLLDIDDGIYNPTGVLYDSGVLYILNSGKNELLSLNSKNSLSKPINLIINPEGNITIDRIDIEILPNDFNITGTYNSGSFDFLGTITQDLGDSVSQITNKLTYSFSGTRNLTGGNNYNINIPTFAGTLSNGTYYLKTNFYSGATLVYEKYFPYLVNADNDLTTMSDNTLSVLTGGLVGNYFSDLSLSGSDLELKDYISGEYLKLTKTGGFVGTGSLGALNIDNFVENITKISDFKIKDFKVDINGNLLTLKIEYYKIFSCYNDKDSVVTTILIKKSF